MELALKVTKRLQLILTSWFTIVLLSKKGPANGILVLIAYAQIPLINANALVTSKARNCHRFQNDKSYNLKIHVYVINVFDCINIRLFTIIMSQCMRFPTYGMCDQQSLRSACAYAQSDQSLC